MQRQVNGGCVQVVLVGRCSLNVCRCSSASGTDVACCPTRIPDRLFTVIRQALATSGKRDTREWPLLDLWYWRDDNDQPEPSYVLQPHDDSSTTIQQMQMSFYVRPTTT
jgi:hypothetical protein